MSERAKHLLAMAIAAPFALLAMGFIAMLLEGYGDDRAQHDRCLKHAVTGYEIKQCR